MNGAVLAFFGVEEPHRAKGRKQMDQWVELLLGNPFGLSSLIVLLVMLGIGGFLAWFLVTRSR